LRHRTPLSSTIAADAGVDVQTQLYLLGFYSGKIDGSFGPATRRALQAYQKARRLPVTGRLDDATITYLVSWETILPPGRDIEMTEGMQEAARTSVKEDLLDPYSAMFEFARAYHFTDADGSDRKAICGTVNAKNQYGAYVGRRYFVAILIGSGPNFSAVSLSDNRDNSMAEQMCRLRLWYPKDAKGK
jgi:peptidoglycan hydrolase-like protein with peptidoglycan-binding domain